VRPHARRGAGPQCRPAGHRVRVRGLRTTGACQANRRSVIARTDGPRCHRLRPDGHPGRAHRQNSRVAASRLGRRIETTRRVVGHNRHGPFLRATLTEGIDIAWPRTSLAGAQAESAFGSRFAAVVCTTIPPPRWLRNTRTQTTKRRIGGQLTPTAGALRCGCHRSGAADPTGLVRAR
jgi:hypothetical protein